MISLESSKKLQRLLKTIILSPDSGQVGVPEQYLRGFRTAEIPEQLIEELGNV